MTGAKRCEAAGRDLASQASGLRLRRPRALKRTQDHRAGSAICSIWGLAEARGPDHAVARVPALPLALAGAAAVLPLPATAWPLPAFAWSLSLATSGVFSHVK